MTHRVVHWGTGSVGKHALAGPTARLRFEVRGMVDAIPAVVVAAPGIRTTLDLPLVTGPGREICAPTS